MIVFIIPLKSKQVSKDWRHVSKLLERCVRSIVNQTSDKFAVIIVCHERPDIHIDLPSIHYVNVDFLPPQLGQVNIISAMDNDKNKKMWLGLEFAEHLKPSHVMFVDADDCVSHQIADFVSYHPDENGWYLNSGYVYEDGSQRIYYKKANFYLMSGTSHIVKYDLICDKSMNSTYTDSNAALHQLVVQILADKQTPLAQLPFPGAIYIVENGENINADKASDRSGREGNLLFIIKNTLLNYPRKLRTFINSQKLTTSLISEYSLIDSTASLSKKLTEPQIFYSKEPNS